MSCLSCHCTQNVLQCLFTVAAILSLSVSQSFMCISSVRPLAIQRCFLLILRFQATRRSAEDALLPLGGDQLPEDPRPSKAIKQPTKTRTITVHNLPIEGCENGVTSLQFEVLSDGIIDDIKRSISERLTNDSPPTRWCASAIFHQTQRVTHIC